MTSHFLPHEIVVQSEGWKRPLIPIRVHRETSSQFATALLLNAWELPYDLEFEMKPGVSEGYWQMSVDMARNVGMTIEKKDDFWKVPANQTANHFELVMEPDYSSSFALAAAGALAGTTVITNAADTSYQPDYRFVSLMQKMGVKVQLNGTELTIRMANEMKPIDVSLESTPDLFPVLSVLCAFAKGESALRGAPHLIHKESNRIEKTAELLRSAGIISSVKRDGIYIGGQGQKSKPLSFTFDPDEDHRMAMAAGLFKLKGFDVQIKNPQVVSKSFPDFWQVLGVRP